MNRVAPQDTAVAVVSRGDDALLQLGGRRAWHFPCAEDGSYLGYYPETGAEAIAHLQELMSRGVEYFVLPSTAFWWLEHYPELNRHLRESCQMVAGEEAGLVFALTESAAAAAVAAPAAAPVAAGAAEATPLRALVESLLPSDAITAVLALEGAPVALDGARMWSLPRRLDGGFAGHLEALAASRVEFLVVPRDELEWLEHQSELFSALEHDHRLVTRQRHVGAIYELLAPSAPAEHSVANLEPATEAEQPRRSLLGRLAAAFNPGDRRNGG